MKDKNTAEIMELPWYHVLNLGQGIVTPGALDLEPFLLFYGLPDDLSGAEVLDVGTASGFSPLNLKDVGLNAW